MNTAPRCGAIFEIVRARPESVLAKYRAYKEKFETVDGYSTPTDAEGWLRVDGEEYQD
jgi:hypothetical protein